VRNPAFVLFLIGLLVTACGVNPRSLLGSGGSGTAASSGAFRTIADFPLPGGISRFDYESYDSQPHRLYIAHLGDGVVVVFDTLTNTVVGSIPGVGGVHGVLVVPELGKVFASATDKNQVAVIDTKSLAVIATVPGGEYPDGLAYDPEVGKVYVSDESGGTDTVIDAHTNQFVATIALSGQVGNTQYDPASHRVYAAVQSRNQIVAIDPGIDRVIGQYDIPGCQEPHGLVIDSVRHLAFVACQANAKLIVLELPAMRVAATYDVGDTPDVLAFDLGLRRLYVAVESGVLAVFDEAATGSSLREVARGFAAPNAHVVAVNPENHHLYLPLPNVDGHPLLRELAVG
jgi:YVTN family beta-propeller protein